VYILDVPLKVGCKLALSQRAVVVVEKTIGQPPLPPSDVVSGPFGTKNSKNEKLTINAVLKLGRIFALFTTLYSFTFLYPN